MIPVKAEKSLVLQLSGRVKESFVISDDLIYGLLNTMERYSIMSLKIEKKTTETKTLALVGRLDTVTAPELEAEISTILPTAESLVLDMEKLEYISSAGLRVILKTQKALTQKAGLKLINVSDDVREVFDITGFSDFLNIE